MTSARMRSITVLSATRDQLSTSLRNSARACSAGRVCTWLSVCRALRSTACSLLARYSSSPLCSVGRTRPRRVSWWRVTRHEVEQNLPPRRFGSYSLPHFWHTWLIQRKYKTFPVLGIGFQA